MILLNFVWTVILTVWFFSMMVVFSTLPTTSPWFWVLNILGTFAFLTIGSVIEQRLIDFFNRDTI